MSNYDKRQFIRRQGARVKGWDGNNWGENCSQEISFFPPSMCLSFAIGDKQAIDFRSIDCILKKLSSDFSFLDDQVLGEVQRKQPEKAIS